MLKARIELPPKLIPVFSGAARYRGAHGGRGSAKTRSFALMTAVRAYMFAEAGVSGVILSAREYMNSLEESSMEEIKQAIRSVPWLDAYFDIGETYIRTKNKRVSYVFAGLRHNVNSIKSKARILIAWIDEAEDVSETAWIKLTPTVREDGSEIWVTWNPEKNGSPTDTRYRKKPPQGAKIVELNYTDNPWFPDVLEQERISDRDRLDDQTYAWIWDGAYRENSDAQILAGKYRVAEFELEAGFDGPYFGLDWGFSQDPTAGVRCAIFEQRLYIEHEAGKVGLENDDIASFMIARLPGIELHAVRGDSARPETISHVKSKGRDGKRANLPRLVGVDKWKGSVEDGIAHLRSYKEIIIHPRCTATLREARMYSYKVDRMTGDVLTDIMDANNHYMDATRYALGPLIKRSGSMGTRANYPNWTTMSVRIRSGGRLAAQSENQINVIATRILPALQADGTWSAPQPTRDITVFSKYIASTIGYADDDMEMTEFFRLNSIWQGRGETFDYVFDETTVKEALNTAFGAGMAELTVSDGRIKPVRDGVRTQWEHSYSPQNMTTPLRRAFKAPKHDDADGVEVEYIDGNTWAKDVVRCFLPGDQGFKIAKIKVDGVLSRTTAWRIGMRHRRALRYRNWEYSFSTELDALNSEYMSYVPLYDDIPCYGQSAILDAIEPVSGGAMLHVSEPLKWEAGQSHVVGYRRPDGTLAGSWPATQGIDDYSVIANIPQPWPVATLKMEPPHVYFGTAERWTFPALITDIKPQGLESVSVTAVNFDARVYADDDNFPPN